jgi:tetratricopeptide (TPR) repeat protein
MGFRRTVGLTIVCALSSLAFETSTARQYFEQARKFFESRQLDNAKTAAEKAAAADPRMGDAEILLGLIATVRMQFGQAEKHFSRAVALEPKNYRAYAYLGSTYLQQKRIIDAANAFRTVLQLSPGNAAANYNLGVIDLAKQLPADALRHFEIAARADPSDAPALIGMLESQLLLRQSREVEHTAQRLATLLDDRDPRLFQVASLLAQHGHYAAAIPLMERARRAFPQTYDINYNLALAYSQTAQYDLAVQALQAYIGPQGKAEAFDLLGSIEEKRTHPDDAERAFHEASLHDPANEDYRFDYAKALLQHEKLEPAVAAFREAVSALPKSAKLRIGLGSACYLSGDYQCAAEELLEAIQLKPDSAAAYFLLGEAYDSAERFQRAIQTALNAYLKTMPHDAWAYYHYGAILFSRGNSDNRAAVASLNAALRLNPRFAEAYLQLGLIAMAQGDVAEGIRTLEKAVALDPDLATAHYRLGLAYQKAGKTERGKEELDRFRALQSENRYRGRILDSLGAMGR